MISRFLAPSRFVPLAACALLLGAVGCSSTQTLTSERATAPITVDGSDADWTGTIRPVEGQAGLGLGIRNDGDALYVAVVMRNERQIQQALRGGLTLWLDPDGGKDQAFGVRFPVGSGGGRPAGGADGRPSGPPDAEAIGEQVAAATASLEIVRDGAASGTRRPIAGDGVQAAATLEGGVLVAEYRIPLADGADTLAAAPGDAIGLGLVTTAPQRPEGARPEGGRGGGGRGGRGGGGSGRGGGRGGAPGGGSRPEAPSPLSVWVGVDLAGATN